jgi:hypothetical protein
LAAPTEQVVGQAQRKPEIVQPLPGEERHALLQALSALGASPDFLANGALIVTVPPLGSAHDQATMAARAALIIRERWPGSAVSLATARGTIRGRTTIGEVVEQAAAMLHRDSQPSPEVVHTPIMIDPLSAKLLTGRFAQVPQPKGALLLSEEKELDASRPLLGRPTPCVGREAELGTLEAQLAGCIDEFHARTVVVTAPPGAGKSRLRHEFLRRVEKRSEQVTVLLGRGDRLNAGAAYGIVARAIRALCGVSGGESPTEQRHRLRLRIERHLPPSEQEQVLPFLGELCGIRFADEDYPLLRAARQTPKILPERMRRACLAWLAAECQAAAAVLFVLDDLHWGDELTVALLDEALRELRSAPLFVLALARPEVSATFPALWKAHRPQELVLKGLSRRACERLIQQTLGRQVSTDVMEWIIEHSGGNALFLEEPMSTLQEDQQLRAVPMVNLPVGLADSTSFRGAPTSRKWCTGGARFVVRSPRESD